MSPGPEDCRFHEAHAEMLRGINTRLSANDDEQDRQWKEIDKRPRWQWMIGLAVLCAAPFTVLATCNLDLNKTHLHEMKAINTDLHKINVRLIEMNGNIQNNTEKIESIRKRLRKTHPMEGD